MLKLISDYEPRQLTIIVNDYLLCFLYVDHLSMSNHQDISGITYIEIRHRSWIFVQQGLYDTKWNKILFCTSNSEDKNFNTSKYTTQY